MAIIPALAVPDSIVDARVVRLVAVASMLGPAVLGVLCGGEGAGTLDAPELASCAAGLGTTHPPGHPAFLVVSSLASLLPLGPLPFRLVFLQSLLLGLLGRMVYEVAVHMAARLSDENELSPRLVSVCALAGSWCATLGLGVFRQATRTEVYALAGVLAFVPMLLSLGGALSSGTRLRLGALALGVGAANHHFIQLAASLPLALLAWERWNELPPAEKTPRAVGRVLASGAVLVSAGMLLYALLFARAEAVASWVRPRTLLELFDVASARIYLKNTGAGVPGTLGSRVAEVLEVLGDTVSPLGLVFALGGLYVLARVEETRRDALRILLVFLPIGAARAWTGFTRNNPDAAGYLVPAVSVLALAITMFPLGVALLLHRAPAAPKGPSPLARIVLRGLLLGGPLCLPFVLLVVSAFGSAEDRAHTGDELALAAYGVLPPRAILFANDPQTIFRMRYARLVEGERPDVTVIPVPLLGYPGMVPALLARDAALTPVLTQVLLRGAGAIAPRNLSAPASQRWVAVETAPENLSGLLPVLLPRGPFGQVTAEPTTLATVRGASAAHFAVMDRLASEVAREPAGRASDYLLWRWYLDALFFAGRGARPEARRALSRALRIEAESRELVALRDALGPEGEGAPLVLEPFLPRTTF